jgi:hypothetical protein
MRVCAFAELLFKLLFNFLSKAFHRKVERIPPQKKHFPLDFLIALSPVSLHRGYEKEIKNCERLKGRRRFFWKATYIWQMATKWGR